VKASVRLKRNDKPAEDKDKVADKGGDKDDKEGRDSRSRLRFWRRDDGESDPNDTSDK
jgi:hypothetical protein